MIIIGDYSKAFEVCWAHYAQTLKQLRKFAMDYGVRVDEVYLPSSAGSKQMAWDKWQFCLKQIRFKEGAVDEELLMLAVECFCNQRIEECHKLKKVRMSMMAVFLNPTPRNDRQPEILDFILLAKGSREMEREGVKASNGTRNIPIINP